jgi:hypothetical protein
LIFYHPSGLLKKIFLKAKPARLNIVWEGTLSCRKTRLAEAVRTGTQSENTVFLLFAIFAKNLCDLYC